MSALMRAGAARPAVGGGGGPDPEPDTDSHWDEVVLLIDASKHSDAVDPHWDDVLLLIDNSVEDS